MMPAIIAKQMPIDAGPMKGMSTRNPTNAPKGSANPEAVAHQKAFDRDMVAARRGTATAMPSGIL